LIEKIFPAVVAGAAFLDQGFAICRAPLLKPPAEWNSNAAWKISKRSAFTSKFAADRFRA
jgi:hypothetical protein